MIGVIDSGSGGVLTAGILSSLLPRADVTLFADRKNSPYGTKSKEEITALTERAILRLIGYGADRILIGCCTASSVYSLLTDELRAVSIPIIEPTAERAVRVSVSGKIGVLATEATVKCGEFERAILRLNPTASVSSVAAQNLVSLVERGVRDGNIGAVDNTTLHKAVLPLLHTGIDTLILGCTHFPYLNGAIERMLDGVKIISCAHEGARRAAALCSDSGNGRLRYTE